MMVPKKSLMLAGAALALFGAASNAQSQSGKVFARYNKPLKSVTLDLNTGTITRGPQVSNRSILGTVTDFDNNDLGGFVGVDTGNGFCRWIDAGVKGTGLGRTAGVNNNSDLVASIVFAYCSAKLTPGSGGPGGSMALHFYEGYTLFGGAPTTMVACFTLTGLPGNTASSSFFGGFNCIFIKIVFAQLLCFDDGPIGYAWTFLDQGTGVINPLGATLAGTWPFLSCTVSCSAAILQVDDQGMTDAIDEYCPTTSLLATFTFGTTSGSFTSISLATEEVLDTTSTITGCPGIPAAADVLTANPVSVGADWTATLTIGITRNAATSWTLFFGSTGISKPTGFLIAQVPSPGNNFGTSKAGRRLLCDINNTSNAPFCTGVSIGSTVGSTDSCSGSIPKKASLICNAWCAQAVIVGPVSAGTLGGGNRRLSTSIAGIVGTNP
jgi:hypothetical protein